MTTEKETLKPCTSFCKNSDTSNEFCRACSDQVPAQDDVRECKCDMSGCLICAEQYKRAAAQQPEVDNEWFFRWASRAMTDGKYEEAVRVIFNHPANPYGKVNPWANNGVKVEG